MTTALIGFVIGALLTAVVAVLFVRRARAEAGQSEEGADAAAARAQLAELRLRELRDAVPLVTLRLDASGKVVEVSLDIDFDCLFTDLAPLEALLQRCGRVNRGRRHALCPVTVFRGPIEDERPYSEALLRAALAVLDPSFAR